MGCGWSSWGKSRAFKCVRVVHISGYVEDFGPGPVTAGDVTGRASKQPARHVLCTAAHLLLPPSPAGPRPFRPDDLLEPGRLYFLLPHAALLSSDSSPLDLACLLNRLSALAKRPSPPRPADPLLPILAACTGPKASPRPMASRRAAWSPQLDRIDERSFGRSRDSMRSTAST